MAVRFVAFDLDRCADVWFFLLSFLQGVRAAMVLVQRGLVLAWLVVATSDSHHRDRESGSSSGSSVGENDGIRISNLHTPFCGCSNHPWQRGLGNHLAQALALPMDRLRLDRLGRWCVLVGAGAEYSSTPAGPVRVRLRFYSPFHCLLRSVAVLDRSSGFRRPGDENLAFHLDAEVPRYRLPTGDHSGGMAHDAPAWYPHCVCWL